MLATLRVSRDLVFVCCLAAAETALVLTGAGPIWLRAVLGVPIVLFFAGYTFTVALIPSCTFDIVDRALYSIGVSLALTALSGLALDATPWGLVSHAWALTVLGTVLVLAVIGALRRARNTTSELRSRSLTVSAVLAATRSRGLSAAVVVFMLVGAVAFGRHDAVAVQKRTGVTELWLLPGPGPSSVRMGVMRQGATAQRYDLVVRHGSRPVLRVQGITLRSGESWTHTIPLGGPLRSEETTASLYLHGSRKRLRFAKLGVTALARRGLTRDRGHSPRHRGRAHRDRTGR